jgi:hypothetical protein
MPRSGKILIREILNCADNFEPIHLRNIRITTSTNSMNPFMNNSTLPIVLTILNLPSWLCNKRKYIMMSGLIPGPQQPWNDIDTYFRPLFEHLKML